MYNKAKIYILVSRAISSIFLLRIYLSGKFEYSIVLEILRVRWQRSEVVERPLDFLGDRRRHRKMTSLGVESRLIGVPFGLYGSPVRSRVGIRTGDHLGGVRISGQLLYRPGSGRFDSVLGSETATIT